MSCSLRADSDPGGANFYIFVPSLGLPITTARVGSSSSTAEKKAVRPDGGRLLIVYSIYSTRVNYNIYSSPEAGCHWLQTCKLPWYGYMCVQSHVVIHPTIV